MVQLALGGAYDGAAVFFGRDGVDEAVGALHVEARRDAPARVLQADVVARVVDEGERVDMVLGAGDKVDAAVRSKRVSGEKFGVAEPRGHDGVVAFAEKSVAVAVDRHQRQRVVGMAYETPIVVAAVVVANESVDHEHVLKTLLDAGDRLKILAGPNGVENLRQIGTAT